MLLYSSDLFEKHDTGTHPECVARIQNVNAMLKEKGWDDRCVRPSWMAASLEQCRRNHDSEYLEQLHRWSRENAGRVESDTVVSTGSWDAAMVGAGAVCDAVDRLWAKQDKAAFCAIRPPGHHALKDAPMGFCVLNNVSIGALHARSLGFERVLIVDWDVHHGNGTQGTENSGRAASVTDVDINAVVRRNLDVMAPHVCSSSQDGDHYVIGVSERLLAVKRRFNLGQIATLIHDPLNRAPGEIKSLWINVHQTQR